MYLGCENNGRYKVLTIQDGQTNTSQGGNILETEIASGSIKSFSLLKPIQQNFKANEINLNESDIIETYNIYAI
jgi:hypothetical protein